MKHHVWIFALLLSAAPAFAQDPEEALRELGMGGVFAVGNLPLRELDQANDPVQQLKRFFIQSDMPLTPDQQKRLEAVVSAQRKVMVGGAQDEQAVGRQNVEFMRRMNGVLLPDQQATWRRFRTEQIMLRGGFPALKLILENARTPLGEEQEKQVQAVYQDFNKELATAAPDRPTVDKLEGGALVKVVRLLSAEQRRALLASRMMSPRAKAPH